MRTKFKVVENIGHTPNLTSYIIHEAKSGYKVCEIPNYYRNNKEIAKEIARCLNEGWNDDFELKV